MLRIRLSRTGKIRQPSYRVVVAEKESKRDGRIVENIGHYNPLPNPIDSIGSVSALSPPMPFVSCLKSRAQ